MSQDIPPWFLFDAWRRWRRSILLLLVLAALFAVGHWGSQTLIDFVDLDFRANAHARHAMISAVVLFAVLMAIPFMPGIEVSIALLATFGAEVAMMLYAATVVSLMITFVIGRLLPERVLIASLRFVGLFQAATLVQRLVLLRPQVRAEVLIAHAPKRIVPTLLRHRYLTLAIAFNLPGNAIIGGGGGIALVAGVSRLFTAPQYIAVVSLAVLPVPLAVMLFGL